MFKKFIWLSVCLFALSACEVQNTSTSSNSSGGSVVTENQETSSENKSNSETTMTKKSKNQTEAVIKTSKGDIAIVLYDDQTPKTVENFIGLAKDGKYDDTIFHRVIEGFMLQAGDYENRNGTGGQSIWGKAFEDEIVSELSHVRGSLSMANAGPGTNGSQFFIVHAPETAYLDGRHTIFGQVTDGMDVVDVIAKVDTDLMDKPLDEVTIESIEIK